MLKVSSSRLGEERLPVQRWLISPTLMVACGTRGYTPGSAPCSTSFTLRLELRGLGAMPADAVNMVIAVRKNSSWSAKPKTFDAE